MTLALLAWFAAQKIRVAPFKVGPDFIDPGHHTAVSGRQSNNLDSWMLPEAYNKRLFLDKAAGSDMAVVEGVMGLFDGYDALSEAGSTAHMAKTLGLPVVLIVSAKGKARSAAAIVKGFETFDKDLSLGGVIFSGTGSDRHYDYLKKAVEQNCTTPCLGHLPHHPDIQMPERHLGLVTAQEQTISEDVLSLLVSLVDAHVDMDRLVALLPEVSVQVPDEKDPDKKGFQNENLETFGSDRPVIAVAKDKAFCFYYPDNLAILEKAGARIVEFSPLNGDLVPEGSHGLYFGGGYPEVFAETLSENQALLDQVKGLSLDGMPIYGECGGFMYLCRAISGMDASGKFLPMTGCFDFRVSMSKRLRSLGYREITLKTDTPIGKKGAVIRGHEFHYSSLEEGERLGPGVSDVYEVTNRDGQDVSLKGFQTNQTLGSYMHVHFGSNPEAARHFVACCREFARQNPGLSEDGKKL